MAPLVSGQSPVPWPAAPLDDDAAAAETPPPGPTPLNDVQREVLLAAAASIGGRLHTAEERAEALAHLVTLDDAKVWLAPLLPFLRTR
ncbi:MAG: hypothetical protein PW843_06800 [Azospirillaceae bacterium]|nr:hypothetical protein [Azospirillaceae bacterium]